MPRRTGRVANRCSTDLSGMLKILGFKQPKMASMSKMVGGEPLVSD